MEIIPPLRGYYSKSAPARILPSVATAPRDAFGIDCLARTQREGYSGKGKDC